MELDDDDDGDDLRNHLQRTCLDWKAVGCWVLVCVGREDVVVMAHGAPADVFVVAATPVLQPLGSVVEEQEQLQVSCSSGGDIRTSSCWCGCCCSAVKKRLPWSWQRLGPKRGREYDHY